MMNGFIQRKITVELHIFLSTFNKVFVNSTAKFGKSSVGKYLKNIL